MAVKPLRTFIYVPERLKIDNYPLLDVDNCDDPEDENFLPAKTNGFFNGVTLDQKCSIHDGVILGKGKYGKMLQNYKKTHARRLFQAAIEFKAILIWSYKDAPRNLTRFLDAGGDEDYIIFAPRTVKRMFNSLIYSWDDSPGTADFVTDYGTFTLSCHA